MALKLSGLLTLWAFSLASSSPTSAPSISPSILPTASPTELPSVSPSISPTGGPSHVPTPAPTPLPTDCHSCPDCVLCPPGDRRDLVFSDGTEASEFPGFAGHFSPETEFTTLSDYCPPREVGSCTACTCSNSDECFSCVADSHHHGYKARLADDTDDNTKSPSYDGEKSLDDVNADDTVSLMEMLKGAEKEVEDSAESNDDVLSLLQTDQNTYEEMYRHSTNANQISQVNEGAVEEEEKLRESISDMMELVRDKDLQHQVNTAKVMSVNQGASAEEALLSRSIESMVEAGKETVSFKEATKTANEASEEEEAIILETISKALNKKEDVRSTVVDDADAQLIAASNKEAIKRVNKEVSQEEAALIESIAKLSKSTDKFDPTDFVQAPVYESKAEKKLAHKETRATKKVSLPTEDVSQELTNDDIMGTLQGFELTNEANKLDGKTSKMIDSSECFICSGFSDETCAKALTTVISDLDDRQRLSIEKELMDSDSTQCSGLKDKDCLTTLDSSFASLNSAGKIDLLGKMCDLVTSSTTKTSKKLGQHTTRDTVIEDAHVIEEPVLMEEPKIEESKGPRFVVAHKPAIQEKVVEVFESTPKKNEKKMDSCEICDGFSQKTCALALTNVISGLTDKTRLTIEKSLLDTDGAMCSSLTDKACLGKLDSSFASLETSSKLDLVDTMCNLLSAADVPTSSVNQVDTTSMTDDAISRTTHTFNTRDALLNFNTPIKSMKVNVNVKIDALVSSLDLDDEPRCIVCDGVDDRTCLAGLEASLRSLTDSQRLLVFARTMGAYPTYAACSVTDGDRTCLLKLDKAYNSLVSSQKLSILTDACTLGAYGTAAATLAVISTATDSVSNVKATMTDLSQSTDYKMHTLISTVASSAADMLAARGGVGSLQEGRAAKFIHVVSSWATTVSTLATDVVPVVTATKDTTASRMMASATSAVSTIATQVRTLVTLASGTSDASTPKKTSSASPNMTSKLGESAFGFILGAAGAAALVYSVFALRRSFTQSRAYSKIPDSGKFDDKGYEAPAFVLSL